MITVDNTPIGGMALPRLTLDNNERRHARNYRTICVLRKALDVFISKLVCS